MGAELSFLHARSPGTVAMEVPRDHDAGQDDHQQLLLTQITNINSTLSKVAHKLNTVSQDIETLVIYSKMQVLRPIPNVPDKGEPETTNTPAPAVEVSKPVDDPMDVIEEISLAAYGHFDFVWPGGSFAFAMFTLHLRPGRKGSLEPRTQVKSFRFMIC